MQTIFRASVQPYLISWFQRKPTEEIKKLKKSILIIQGGNDLQVHTEDAEALKKAATHAQLHIIPKMNHVLKQSSAERVENLSTYNQPKRPLHQALMPFITAFINEHAK